MIADEMALKQIRDLVEALADYIEATQILLGRFSFLEACEELEMASGAAESLIAILRGGGNG